MYGKLFMGPKLSLGFGIGLTLSLFTGKINNGLSSLMAVDFPLVSQARARSTTFHVCGSHHCTQCAVDKAHCIGAIYRAMTLKCFGSDSLYVPGVGLVATSDT